MTFFLVCKKKKVEKQYVIYEKGKRTAIKNPLLHSSKKKAQNDDVIYKNCLFQVGKKCLASYFGFTVRCCLCHEQSAFLKIFRVNFFDLSNTGEVTNLKFFT